MMVVWTIILSVAHALTINEYSNDNTGSFSNTTDSTPTLSNSSHDSGEDDHSDEVTLSTILLLCIPTVLGFSLSIALVKRSFFSYDFKKKRMGKKDEDEAKSHDGKKPNPTMRGEFHEIELDELESNGRAKPPRESSPKIIKTINYGGDFMITDNNNTTNPNPDDILKKVNHPSSLVSKSLRTFGDWFGILPFHDGRDDEEFETRTDNETDIASSTSPTSTSTVSSVHGRMSGWRGSEAIKDNDDLEEGQDREEIKKNNAAKDLTHQQPSPSFYEVRLPFSQLISYFNSLSLAILVNSSLHSIKPNFLKYNSSAFSTVLYRYSEG